MSEHGRNATSKSFDLKVLQNLGEMKKRLQGGNIVGVEHDRKELTYVSSGMAAGEVETVVYKLNGAVVATLTMSYDPGTGYLTTIEKS